MNEKKKSNTKNKPEHVVRQGEATAVINLRQSNAGYAYYDFSLSRCWSSLSTAKEAHGVSFFDKHEEDLIKVIREASAWIRAKLQGNLSMKETDTDGEGR